MLAHLHTHRHIHNTLTHTHTLSHRHTHSSTHTQTLFHTYTDTHFLTHSHTHTDTLTYTLSHTHTHTQTHTLSHTQTHTHSHTDTLSHTLTHRHTFPPGTELVLAAEGTGPLGSPSPPRGSSSRTLPSLGPAVLWTQTAHQLLCRFFGLSPRLFISLPVIRCQLLLLVHLGISQNNSPVHSNHI